MILAKTSSLSIIRLFIRHQINAIRVERNGVVKRWVTALFVLAIVSFASAIYAYRRGLWIPNYPSEAAYPVRGIDVSHYQGKIDWDLVGQQKVNFVYIKATEGGDHHDMQFADNWMGSQRIQLRHGAYHFFTFKTPGKIQAKNFIDTVPKEATALPPVIDLEYGGNSAGRPTATVFQQELRDFITDMKAAFKTEPVIYTDEAFLNSYLRGFDCPRLWIGNFVGKPNPKWTFWQFSERTRVPGIKGFVDSNVFSRLSSDFENFK